MVRASLFGCAIAARSQGRPVPMTQESIQRDRVLALSGGVGGAKLALGLRNVVPAGKLTVVANTGDDFEHLGLHVSPDIDTLLYTLAGLDNPETGWGRRDETWTFMAILPSTSSAPAGCAPASRRPTSSATLPTASAFGPQLCR